MAIAGIPHLRAVRALQKAGFRIVRQGKHIVMTNGKHVVAVPRHDPVNANTMAVIVRGAGLTPEAFRNCSDELPEICAAWQQPFKPVYNNLQHAVF